MTLLAATDLSTRSAAALRFAEELSQALDEPLRVLHVGPPHTTDWANEAQTALGTFSREYLEHPEVAQIVCRFGDPYAEIVSAAQGADLVVCGATGENYSDEIFLGSTASRLLRESPVPVCVVPDGSAFDRGTILVPVAFDHSGRNALRYAVNLARRLDAPLCLVHAVDVRHPVYARQPTGEDITRLIEEARGQLELWAQEEGAGDLMVSFDVLTGEPAAVIRKAVLRFEAGIVVMGTHGRGAQTRYFLGSVAERTVRQPPCPIIAIHQ